MKKEDEQFYEEKNEEEDEDEEEENEESNDIIDLDEEIQTQNSNKERNHKEENKDLDSPMKSIGQISVANLKDINMNTVNKEELINFLLYSDQNPLKDAVSSKKIDNYSVNASKTMKANRNYRDIKIKSDDPEIKNNDFNTAYSKVVNNMMNYATTNGDHPEILKILLSGDNNNDEIKKVSNILIQEY